MASLPNSDRALIDERKLIEYALNPDHARGGDKARQFAAALGYDRSNCDILVAQMRKALGAHEAVLVRQDGYGRHYRVDLTLAGPRGKAQIRTGWLVDRGSDVPRLTTAYVLRRSGRTRR